MLTRLLNENHICLGQFSIAFSLHFQDFVLDAGGCGESFETSVPWDKCEKLCSNVKAAVGVECKKHAIEHYLVSCRVTQTYDAGACVYFYLGFPFFNLSDPIHTFEEIENSLRDEILISGKYSSRAFSEPFK